MAFATYVGAGTQAAGTGTITPSPNASHASGNYELLFIETMDEAVSLTTAAGFTEHPGSPISAPNATATVATRLTVYERIWNGSDGDPTTNDPGNHIMGIILSFAPPSGSWSALTDVRSASDGVGWKATTELTEDTSGSMDGITTSVADELIVGLISCAKPDNLSTIQLSAITNANLANITERIDDCDNSGNGGGQGAWTGECATASTAIGATTFTWGSVSYKAMLVTTIMPPSGGGGATEDPFPYMAGGYYPTEG